MTVSRQAAVGLLARQWSGAAPPRHHLPAPPGSHHGERPGASKGVKPLEHQGPTGRVFRYPPACQYDARSSCSQPAECRPLGGRGGGVVQPAASGSAAAAAGRPRTAAPGAAGGVFCQLLPAAHCCLDRCLLRQPAAEQKEEGGRSCYCPLTCVAAAEPPLNRGAAFVTRLLMLLVSPDR